MIRGETSNVAKKFPDVKQELSAGLAQWIKQTSFMSSKEQQQHRPITLAHPDAKYTQLPSRDAIMEGAVKRSNKFPNCTYVTNWKDTDSKIVWNVDVLSEGDYDVQMYFAAETAGSKIQLSIGDERISAVIDEAHDPPLLGAEHDRFKRVEGYVKRWREMNLGTIHLTPGEKPLVLSAIEVAGDQVAEMRLLMFTRK